VSPGMLLNYSCYIQYNDAGKACLKDTDCDGDCIISTESSVGRCKADNIAEYYSLF